LKWFELLWEIHCRFLQGERESQKAERGALKDEAGHIWRTREGAGAMGGIRLHVPY
jgi:hypothetical protein